jgi:uncharacterized membrane protein YeaQ/YmgE (transglycosylase-associated protein family)
VDNNVTIGLISRIVARYISGSIVTLGFVDAATGKLLFPDIEGLLVIVLGALIGLATEWFYKLARQWGWAK